MRKTANMEVIWCCLLLLGGLFFTDARQHEECQPGPDDELIWEYDVRRSYRIGSYQEVDAEYGPTRAIITCIRINSLSNEDNNAVWVTSGGTGQNFLRLKFRSKYSRGLHYRVFVYGRPTLRRNQISSSQYVQNAK